jgi:Arc/MetJ-type ribon-helix-helix transcriptional regulator
VQSNNDKTFYTETMARLLTRQGRYDSAAEVYHYLLERQPHRLDFKQALEEVLARIPQGADNWEAVSQRVDRWVTLMLRHKALRQLQQLSIPQVGDKRQSE